MDEDDIVSSVLDLYAEDATQTEMSTGKSLWIVADNPDVQKLADDLFQRVQMEDKVFSITRSIAKFGDRFDSILQHVSDQGLPTSIAGLRVYPPVQVSRYEDEFGRLRGFVLGEVPTSAQTVQPTGETDSLDISEPWDFIHWRLYARADESEGIYGTSILQAARRIYRYLYMMEQALVIYRMRRAPDRLKWKVDTGDAPPDEAEQILTTFRERVRKKMLTDPETGEVVSELNPLGIDEDIFLPVGLDSKTDVELMKGAGVVGNILDLDYIRKRFFSCVRVPPDFMGFADTSGTLTGRAPLTDQEVRYARGVKRLQRAVMIGAVQLVQIELTLRGLDVTKSENHFTAKMHPVSFLDEQVQAETMRTRAETVVTLLDLGKRLEVDQPAWMEYVGKLSGLPQELLRAVSQEDLGNDKRRRMLAEAIGRQLVTTRDQIRRLGPSAVESKNYPLPFALPDRKRLAESVERKRSTKHGEGKHDDTGSAEVYSPEVEEGGERGGSEG